MRAIIRLLALSVGLIVATSAAWAEPMLLSDVLASPAKFHDTVIQISGVFWTDGEGSFLIEAPTEMLDLDRAVAVSADWKDLTYDENYQRLKADRLAYIQKKKADDPKATWIVFQTAVVFEGRLVDALSLPVPKDSEGRLANPYRGCRTKIELRRVVSYSAKNQRATRHPQRNALDVLSF